MTQINFYNNIKTLKRYFVRIHADAITHEVQDDGFLGREMLGDVQLDVGYCHRSSFYFGGGWAHNVCYIK